jgi:CRISPR/Cas system-associated endonuclease/helicase Cas3
VSYNWLVQESIESTQDGSTVTILNTIDSANLVAEKILNDKDSISVNELLGSMPEELDVFEDKIVEQEFPQRQKELTGDEYFHIHLTSRHRPIDRLRLIRLIKSCDSSSKLLVTSTQILEAGVDVSFRSVYRDLAPIQNISQSAGRCNRNNELDTGKVTIFYLPHPKDTDKQTPSEAVYSTGTDVISLTASILSDIDNSRQFSQKELDYDGVIDYYNKLRSKTKGDMSYVEKYNSCNLSFISDLSLIDTNRSIELIITDDESGIQDIRDAYQSYNFEIANSLREDMKLYELSVPMWSDEDVDKIQSIPFLHPSEENRRVITSIRSSIFYTYTYGFQVPDSTSSNRIL